MLADWTGVAESNPVSFSRTYPASSPIQIRSHQESRIELELIKGRQGWRRFVEEEGLFDLGLLQEIPFAQIPWHHDFELGERLILYPPLQLRRSAALESL